MSACSVLIIGGPDTRREQLCAALGALCDPIESVSGLADARRALEVSRWDCVILSRLQEVAAVRGRAATVYLASDEADAVAGAGEGADACLVVAELSESSARQAVWLACARHRQHQRQRLAGDAKLISLAEAVSERLSVPLAWASRQADEAQVAETPADAEAALAEVRARLGQCRDALHALRRLSVLRPGPIQSVDLSAVVEMVWRRIDWPRHARFSLQLPPVPVIAADAAQLMLAVDCLLQNAADAIGARPPNARSVTLRTWSRDERVGLIVSDSGAGVSRALGRQIFSPLFGLTPDRTGIGLWLADAVATRHRGRLRLLCASPSASFSLILPHETGLLAPKVTDIQLVSDAPRAAPRRSALVLAGDPALAEALRALPRAPEITTVETVAEALDALRVGVGYSLIVCDAATAEGPAPGLLAQLPGPLAAQLCYVFLKPPPPDVARRLHARRCRILPWPLKACG